MGSSARNSRASASTNAAAAPWLTATPFGVPVEPEVKMIQASSPGPGRPGVPTARVRRSDTASPSPSTAHDPRLGEHELGAFLGIVRVDRHVGGARREHAEDREVQLGRTGGDPDADAVADTDAAPRRATAATASTSSASSR